MNAGVDILWIGARTSANPFAIQEIADSLAAAKIDIPVLIKNPVNPDLELWIGALQRKAIWATPLFNFMGWPGTVLVPSGKIRISVSFFQSFSAVFKNFLRRRCL